MNKQSTCTFKITGWDEKPYREFDNGAKLTRAKVSQAYQGAIVGEGSIEFLMSYAADGSASFVGLELVTGILDGKSGGFVIQHVGTYDSGGARSNWSIVPAPAPASWRVLRETGVTLRPASSRALRCAHGTNRLAPRCAEARL